LVMLLPILLLASCNLGRGTKPVDPACILFKPIFVSKDDVLTDGTAKAILAHNMTGAEQCGWKPRSTP
jgi:hypothetical protein